MTKSLVEFDKLYVLKISEDCYFEYNPEVQGEYYKRNHIFRFNEEIIFQHLLEEYLQNSGQTDGVWFPHKGKPWIFLKGKNLEEILSGAGETIVTFHADDKDALWQLYEWTSGSVTGMKVVVDY